MRIDAPLFPPVGPASRAGSTGGVNPDEFNRLMEAALDQPPSSSPTSVRVEASATVSGIRQDPGAALAHRLSAMGDSYDATMVELTTIPPSGSLQGMDLIQRQMKLHAMLIETQLVGAVGRGASKAIEQVTRAQ